MAYTSLTTATSEPTVVVATRSNASTSRTSAPRGATETQGHSKASAGIPDHESALTKKIRDKVWEFVGVDRETGEALFEGPTGDTSPWDFSVEWSVDDPMGPTETCATTNGTMP
tara:strand:- start:1065 stop:1406 length:342 start_codon:yes stop_codon:yes gene_type:complete